ncbi:MAG: 4-hydroxythreonine-4-phosphate dehydrogenase PdxA [Ignavibacteria bacterium]|nr:4-hydroxythreonine-4-phosphate dehydrogenase PdxA [Ignavibacteria bacterium]
MKPTIAITIGDFNGIGPEVALKAAVLPSVRKMCVPLLVGPLNVFEHVRSTLKIRLKLQKAVLPWKDPSTIPVLDVGDGLWSDIQYGAVTKAAGRTAGIAIEKAVEMCTGRKADAMVTAPVSKEALHLAGYNFPGQTEMIAMISRSQRVAMMLISKGLRVGLITIHTPLQLVAGHITKEKIVEKLMIFDDSLKRNFKIKAPRIAVLALNPHAGEQGWIGREEQETIAPAIGRARSESMNIDGPFAADGFFGAGTYKSYDAVVAMYHDQGLIPIKMSSFKEAVNFSAGLSIIRTSPGHGTAYDIAGRGKASVSSMVEAITLAVQFVKNAWSSSTI